MPTPKQIHDELKTYTDNFRPELGNPTHIAIVKEIQKLGQLNKEFQTEIERVSKLKSLQIEIRSKKSNILFLFKKQ